MTTFATTLRANPLLSDWSSQPYGLPPFASLKPEHFKPAFLVGFDAQLAELKAIAESAQPPTFDNTIAAFDRCGGVLSRTGMVFSNLCSSNAPEALQKVQLEMAPLLASHESAVYTYPGLFSRIAAVHESRLGSDSSLNPEQIRLVERIHLDFVRAGAKFSDADQKRYTAIMERMSTLLTQFQQNVMADESEVTIDLTEKDMEGECRAGLYWFCFCSLVIPSSPFHRPRLPSSSHLLTHHTPKPQTPQTGCPDFLISAAKAAAAEKNKPEGTFVITLSRSLVEPFLTFSPRRDLRERAWRLWTRRGQLDPARDNLSLAKEILLLRCDQAQLHGYESFAAYQTADTMAQAPAKVMELLERVWGPAVAATEKERGLLEDFLSSQQLEASGSAGGSDSVGVEPWDWRYAAENVRKEKFDFNEAELKPYLSLPAMQTALFSVCERLYGLRFKRVANVVAYHPDVEVYEVRETVTGSGGEEEDRLVAVFLHDNYARSNKQSGAWMSAFQEQTRNSNAYSFAHLSAPDDKLYPASASATVSASGATDADAAFVHISSVPSGQRVVPIIINNNNFARGDAQTPCLLSFDDAITLFHEMVRPSFLFISLLFFLFFLLFLRCSFVSALSDPAPLRPCLPLPSPPSRRATACTGCCPTSHIRAWQAPACCGTL